MPERLKIGLLGGGFGPGTGPDTYARALAQALAGQAEPFTGQGVGFDLIHVVDAKRVKLSWLAKLKTPVVLDFHDDYWTVPPNYPAPDRLLRRLRRRQLRRHHLAALRFAAAVIVHSRSVAESIEREIEKLKLPSPPQVFTVPYSLPSPPPGVASSTVGTGIPDQPIILLAGRDLFRKGFPTLLAAMKKVKEKIPGARLAVAGREWPHTRLVARLMARGQAELLGPLRPEDLANWYRKASVVVLPSYQEAFGLTLLEAMAAGTPVVGSRVGGIPEAVDDGVSGLLHRPADADDLAEKIIGVLTDPGRREKLIAGGRERAASFGPGPMSAALDETYAAAATAPRRSPARIGRGRRLVFAAAACLLFLIAAETVLRLHDFSFYFNFGADLLGMPLLDLHRIRRVQNRTVEFDPILFWRFKPNQTLTDSSIYRRPVTINAHGFRGPDYAVPKPEGVYRVVCLGDSSTFGWSVGDSETFPARLRVYLQKICPLLKVEVLNLGVTGYTSHQGRRLLELTAKDLQPDAIVFAFGPNDRLPALKSDRDHEFVRTWDIGPVSLLLSRLQLYKLMKAGVVYLENRREGLDLDAKTYIPRLKRKVSAEEYADNLRAVKAVCERQHAALLVLNVQFPSLPLDYVDQELKKQADAVGAALPAGWKPWDAAAVSGTAQSLGVPWLDLNSLFNWWLKKAVAGEMKVSPIQQAIPGVDQEPWRMLMIDNGHPNPFGHDLIAQIIARHAPGWPGFVDRCASTAAEPGLRLPQSQLPVIRTPAGTLKPAPGSAP